MLKNGDMFLCKTETSSASSDLNILGDGDEGRECGNKVSNFDEGMFFGQSVLDVDGGGLFYNAIDTEPQTDFLEYLKKEWDALSDVHDLVLVTNSVKLVKQTDQLVKLLDERKPFFESRKNLIIAQKPLDMNKKTGRLAFVKSDLTLIEKNSKLKIFLRDTLTKEDMVWDLNTLASKNKCICFDEHHNKSLFCLRSRYEEAVQIKWAENKYYSLISVDGDFNDDKFVLLFAPLICQSMLKNSSNIIMELIFQMETDAEILEQTYFIKFCSFPRRDIKHFIKTLFNENLVDESFLENEAKPTVSGLSHLCRVEYPPEHDEEFKKFIKSIHGKIAFE